MSSPPCYPSDDGIGMRLLSPIPQSHTPPPRGNKRPRHAVSSSTDYSYRQEIIVPSPGDGEAGDDTDPPPTSSSVENSSQEGDPPPPTSADDGANLLRGSSSPSDESSTAESECSNNGRIRIGLGHQALIPDLGSKIPFSSVDPELAWNPRAISESSFAAYASSAASLLRQHLDGLPKDTGTYSMSPLPTRSERASADSSFSDRCPAGHPWSREMDPDSIFRTLHSHKYDVSSALEEIRVQPADHLSMWSKTERVLFDDGFRRYCGSLRMISRGIREKSVKEVVDYHYRWKVPEVFCQIMESKRGMVLEPGFDIKKKRKGKGVDGRENQQCGGDTSSLIDLRDGKTGGNRAEVNSDDGASTRPNFGDDDAKGAEISATCSNEDGTVEDEEDDNDRECEGDDDGDNSSQMGQMDAPSSVRSNINPLTGKRKYQKKVATIHSHSKISATDRANKHTEAKKFLVRARDAIGMKKYLQLASYLELYQKKTLTVPMLIDYVTELLHNEGDENSDKDENGSGALVEGFRVFLPQKYQEDVRLNFRRKKAKKVKGVVPAPAPEENVNREKGGKRLAEMKGNTMEIVMPKKSMMTKMDIDTD